MPMPPVLNLTDLRYRFAAREQWTLAGVTLKIHPGERVLLAGPTGSGKSTLVRCLTGWLPAEAGGERAGAVSIGGLDPAQAAPGALATRLGLLLQSPDDQLFSPGIAEEIAFGLENRCVPRADMTAIVERSLRQFGLHEVRDTPIPHLSGGTRQRVALAATLASGPGLLVLDEPLSQLDPGACARLLALLDALSRDPGLAVLLVEHRLAQAAPWCDRVVLIDGGTLVLDLPIGEAFRDPAPYRRLGLRVPETVAVCEACGVPARPLRASDVDPALGRRLRPGSIQAVAPPATEPLVRVEALAVRYGRRARPVLEDVSLTLARGTTTALLGANGAGKSTLLRVLCGLTRPSAGRLVWPEGADAGDAPLRAGLVFQDPDLMLQARTVAEEIHWGARQRGGGDAHQAAREAALIRALRLEGLEAEAPQALSRGQRQRVALAAVLALAPALLCLDEPTTGQDRASVEALLRALSELDPRPAVLVATQDVGFALEAADRILVLHEGRLAAAGAPLDVLARSAALSDWGLTAPEVVQLAERLGVPPVRRVADWQVHHVG